ncbi:MAG: DNA-binding protein WhiA [Firmicutes bacterium]|nr:DNA-binding protein WhiA [Candidatus Colimorpha enterica]
MQTVFSISVRDEICRTKLKNKCCRRSQLCGMVLGLLTPSGISVSSDRENVALCFSKLLHEFLPSLKTSSPFLYSRAEADLITSSLGIDGTASLPVGQFTCVNCGWAFIRGLFAVCGTVADPASGYHLEYLLRSSEIADGLCRLFEGLGYTPGITERRGSYGVYFKDSEAIADILGYMGAPSSEFEMLNAKILKDVRNGVNRTVNCETANMNRTCAASSAQIKAIEKIASSPDTVASLTEELKTTLDLRIANPDATLSELAELHDPPVTKSGVTHRLQKLMKIASKL